MSTEPRVPTSQLDTLSQLPSNATEDQVWIANLARDLLDADQLIGNLENEVRTLTAQLEAARLVNRQALTEGAFDGGSRLAAAEYKLRGAIDCARHLSDAVASLIVVTSQPDDWMPPPYSDAFEQRLSGASNPKPESGS